MRSPQTKTTAALALLLAFVATSGCSDRTQRRDGETDLEWGERLFAHLGCVACHSLSGARLQGPPMGQQWLGPVPLRTGETAILDEEYVKLSIAEPTAQVRDGYFPVMLPYTDLSPEQVEALVVFWRDRSVGE